MKFSVIVPSFNQENFIAQTLENLKKIKELALTKNAGVEILVFDSESNSRVQDILQDYKSTIDFLEVKKDAGQFDAINKGILRCSGDYWTWLNTDDLLDEEGFLKVIDLLTTHTEIDYIYGGVAYMDEQNQHLKTVSSWPLNLNDLITKEAAIFQPGSWFKKSMTNKVGLLDDYQCCFDYEYICRLLKHNAKFYNCNFTVSKFRYYPGSKSGSIVSRFIQEQLVISKMYGRKWYHFLNLFLRLRLLKHTLFS